MHHSEPAFGKKMVPWKEIANTSDVYYNAKTSEEVTQHHYRNGTDIQYYRRYRSSLFQMIRANKIATLVSVSAVTVWKGTVVHRKISYKTPMYNLVHIRPESTPPPKHTTF